MSTTVIYVEFELTKESYSHTVVSSGWGWMDGKKKVPHCLLSKSEEKV